MSSQEEHPLTCATRTKRRMGAQPHSMKRRMGAQPHSMILWSLLLCAASVNAWSSTGHQVVAEIARRHLTDAENAAVKSAMAPMLPLTLPAVTDFVSSAHWMDDIKSDTHVFDAWHYVDADVGTAEPVFASDAANVVTVLRSLLPLHHASHSAFVPAFKIYTVTHLVGDVHQPFHCGQRDDRGGNDFPIAGMGHIRNLHALWDEGVGLFTPSTSVADLAESIMSEYPTPPPPDTGSAGDWARESWSIAKATYDELQPNTRPSDEYIEKSQAIVKKQLAKAGYRLAVALKLLG